MKKRTAVAGVVAAVCMMGAALFLSAGCEEAEGIRAIDVTPSGVTLKGETNTVQFTAMTGGNLALPLEWSVSNPALGSISGAGTNAVYLRTAAVGNNLVIVRDQYKAEGYATVIQR